MPLSRWWLTLCALGTLLLGRREAADRRFSELLRRWPGDVYALAGRAHLRAELCRRVEALVDAHWLSQYDFDRSAAEPENGLAP